MMSDQHVGGVAAGEALPLPEIDDAIAQQQRRVAGERVQERIDTLSVATDVLAATLFGLTTGEAALRQQHAVIGQQLEVTRARREATEAQLIALRTEAYEWVLANNGVIAPGQLCVFAVTAATIGRALDPTELDAIRRRAENLGRLQPGEPILRISGGAAGGFMADGTIGFDLHGDGLAIQLGATQRGREGSSALTQPIEELFADYGPNESTRRTGLYIGADAISAEVTAALSADSAPDRPSAASLVIALHRAGLALRSLGIDPGLITMTRDKIVGIAADPQSYAHHRITDTDFAQQGHTGAASAEAWQAAFLIDRPPHDDDSTARAYDQLAARTMAKHFMGRLSEGVQPSADRVKTIVENLRLIDPGVAAEVQSAADAKLEESKT